MSHSPSHALSRAALLAALTCVVAAQVGCAKPEKPKELREIEALWQDPNTRKVKDIPGAAPYYREARQFRYDAQEAYNEREVELAREYAIWSKLRYRTALAIAMQFKAKDRLDAANAKMAEVNPELIAINQERNKLLKEVSELERQVAVARRMKEAEDRRVKALASSGSNFDDGQDEAAKLRAVDDKIRQVEGARSEAIRVNAEKNAAATFNRAENRFKSIRTMRASSPVPYKMIMDSSDAAIRDFEAAAREAQPGYKKEVAKQDPAARRQALLNRAQVVLGASNAMQEGVTIRVVAPGSFNVGSSSFNGSGQNYLRSIIDLAKTYDEFQITVEAFTSRGDPTENLGTSQLRARAVEDALIAGGIDKNRVESKGHGQDRIRFPGETLPNERFEVIFRR